MTLPRSGAKLGASGIDCLRRLILACTATTEAAQKRRFRFSLSPSNKAERRLDEELMPPVKQDSDSFEARWRGLNDAGKELGAPRAIHDLPTSG